jgi:hypothetical protein
MFLAIIGRIVGISMAILALAKQLYVPSPLACSVTFTGQSFDHGDTLSLAAVRGLPSSVTKVDALVRRLLTPPGYLRTKQDIESLTQGQV